MTVETKRHVDATFERFTEHEVQPIEMIKLITLDIALNELWKGRLDPLARQLFLDERVITGVISPNGYVRCITLIAGTGMGDFVQLNMRHWFKPRTVSRKSALRFDRSSSNVSRRSA